MSRGQSPRIALDPLNRSLALPDRVTDITLALAYDDIIGLLPDARPLTWDFTKTTWIELTSLFRILALFCRPDNQAPFCLRLPRPTGPHDPKTSSAIFLLRSGFIAALGRLSHLLARNALYELPYSRGDDARVEAQNDAIRRYIYDDQQTPASDRSFFTLSGGQRRTWQIAASSLLVGQGREDLLFKPFGYRLDRIGDRFVMPISVYSQNDRQYATDTGDRVASSLAFREHKMFLLHDEIVNTFHLELLHNAFDHGGPIIFSCIRIADATLDGRIAARDDLASYQREFLRDCLPFGTRFAEIVVADTGDGIFETLKQDYIEFNHPTATHTQRSQAMAALEQNPRRRLMVHGHALHPTSSRRRRAIDDPLYTTGLGVISQYVLNGYATLAVKDRSDLSFFTSSNCARPDQLGQVEPRDAGDYGATLVDILLPASEERWLTDNSTRLPPGHVVGADSDPAVYAYYLIQPPPGSLYTSYFGQRGTLLAPEDAHQVSLPGTRMADLATVVDTHRVSRCAFAVLDLAHFRLWGKNDMEASLLKCLAELIKHGSMPILVNADVASFRFLQTLVDTHPRRRDTAIRREVVALMISDSFDVCWCGQRGCVAKRPELDEWLRSGAVTPSIEPLLLGYGASPQRRPDLRIIYQLLNDRRADSFVTAVSLQAGYHIKDSHIVTSRGDVTDEYYAFRRFVRTRLFSLHFAKDLKRLLSYSSYDTIATDSPEIASLVQDFQQFGWRPDLAVVRVTQLQFEHVGRCRNSKRLLLMPCVVRTGRSLAIMLTNAHNDGISVSCVSPLCDLRKPGEPCYRPSNVYRPFAVVQFAERAATGVNAVEPQYFAADDGSLVQWGAYSELYDTPFRPLLTRERQYSLLEQEGLLSFRHEEVGGHHYDVFLDVRRALHGNYRLRRVFVKELTNLARAADVVVYPQQSDLFHISDILSTSLSGKVLPCFPLKGIAPGRMVLDSVGYSYPTAGGAAGQELALAHDAEGSVLRGKRVLFVDEGAYTGATVIGALCAVLREEPTAVTIFVLEHRPATGLASVVLKRLLAEAGCKVECSALLSIPIPVFGESNCPTCLSRRRHQRECRNSTVAQGCGLCCGYGADTLGGLANRLDPTLEVDGLQLTTVAAAALWAFEILASPIHTIKARCKRLLAALRQHSSDVAGVTLLRCLLLRPSQTTLILDEHSLLDLIRLCYRTGPTPRQRAEVLTAALHAGPPVPGIKEHLICEALHLVSKPAQPDGKPALPSDALCYLVGCDGVFKQVRNDFYAVRLKVSGVGGLAEIGETAVLNVPKLPEKLLRQVEAFFVAVYDKHESEAVVLLLCNPATKEWRVEVPQQAVQGLHVKYDTSKLPDPPAGFQRFGSIHSHAGIQAFHSGTDDSDEAAFDGLHITIGNLDQPVRSYSCRWMLAGKAFKAELTEVVEGASLPEADPAWLAKVEKAKVPEPPSWFGMQPQGQQPRGELFPPDPMGGFEPEEFNSPEEYRAYLEEVREEVEGRLFEVEAALEEKGP